jgi:hypothetical protein
MKLILGWTLLSNLEIRWRSSLGEDEEVAEEPFFDQLSRFIKTNEKFLLELIGKWTKQSSRQFYAKTGVVVAVLLSSSVLCGYGKISGETFAGTVGVVLGYVLGKGVL